MDPESSRLWVELRIIPPDRQNLGMILRDNGLDEYDPFRLLILAGGRCAQDDCFIVKLKETQLPEPLRRHLQQTLVSIIPLPGLLSGCEGNDTGLTNHNSLDAAKSGHFGDFKHSSTFEAGQEIKGYLLFYRDGLIQSISSDALVPDDPQTRQQDRLVRYQEKLSNLAIQTGGHGLQLQGNLFVSAADLRKKGTPLPITNAILRSCIQENVIDTLAAAALLHCTRQNIQNLVQRGRLKPVLVTNNHFLFMREDVLALQ